MARLGYRTQNPNAYASIRQVLTALGVGLDGGWGREHWKKNYHNLVDKKCNLTVYILSKN